MDLAISLATQIGALFIMIGVGYVLIKTDICTISESKLLSQIVLYVSAPCAIINSFQIDLAEEKLKGFLLSIGAAILIHIIYFSPGVLIIPQTKLFHLPIRQQHPCLRCNSG